MAIVLSDQQVAELLDIGDLIEGVERALVDLSKGLSINPNRLRIFVKDHGSMIACMPAYLEAEGVLGAKVVGSSDKPPPPGHPRSVSSIVALLNAQGRFLSIMSGAKLGPMRTAAASAVATRLLARADASAIAMIGCGMQARYEILGQIQVRPIQQIFVYDINREVAERYRQEVASRFGLRVTVMNTPEEAVDQADIVTLATTSDVPVVSGAAVRQGTHINAVGSHTPRTRELDSDVVVRARLFVEYRHAILSEAGDVIIPIQEGRITTSHVVGEIGEVAVGLISGRLHQDEITIFKSTGIAVEDVVAAKIVYDIANARSIGHVIEF